MVGPTSVTVADALERLPVASSAALAHALGAVATPPAPIARTARTLKTHRGKDAVGITLVGERVSQLTETAPWYMIPRGDAPAWVCSTMLSRISGVQRVLCIRGRSGPTQNGVHFSPAFSR